MDIKDAIKRLKHDVNRISGYISNMTFKNEQTDVQIRHLDNRVKMLEDTLLKINDNLESIDHCSGKVLNNYQNQIDVLADTLDAVCEDVSKIKKTADMAYFTCKVEKPTSGRFPWGESTDADNTLLTRENVINSLTDDELAEIVIKYNMSMWPGSDDKKEYPVVLYWREGDNTVHTYFFSNKNIMEEPGLANAISELMKFVPNDEEKEDN